MFAILLTGIIAYRFLPLSALPEVDYPTIQVQTLYPGASPEVMTSSVTAPLERQFGEMPGLNQMSSASSAGASVITLQFSLSLSLDIAEQEVQAAINAAGNLLPSDLPAPPIYAKVNPADAPVLTLALTSATFAPDPGRGSRRPSPGPEDLAAARRRLGLGQRRSAAGRPGADQSARASRLRPLDRRRPHHPRQRPTSTRRRATSAARNARPPSTPTIRSPAPKATVASSSPITTVPRCGCRTWPR